MNCVSELRVTDAAAAAENARNDLRVRDVVLDPVRAEARVPGQAC